MSRPQAIHENSLSAFHGQQEKLSKRARAIFEWIKAHGPSTDRQVMQGMGFLEPNSVRPRITELLNAPHWKLMEVGNVTCPITKKTVRRVDIRRPRQGDLYQ